MQTFKNFWFSYSQPFDLTHVLFNRLSSSVSLTLVASHISHPLTSLYTITFPNPLQTSFVFWFFYMHAFNYHIVLTRLSSFLSSARCLLHLSSINILSHNPTFPNPMQNSFISLFTYSTLSFESLLYLLGYPVLSLIRVAYFINTIQIFSLTVFPVLYKLPLLSYFLTPYLLFIRLSSSFSLMPVAPLTSLFN